MFDVVSISTFEYLQHQPVNHLLNQSTQLINPPVN